MNASSEEQSITQSSRPLQNIRAIENSLMVLKQKLTQMNKRQSQNAQQIQKVFYFSISNLKNKLYQTIECQKAQQKKKILFNESILRQKKKKNLQRKLINEKEIQRKKELMNMMKINQHNQVKEGSRKNNILIQNMKNLRIQQNKRKKQKVRNSLQKSRNKIKDFYMTKQVLTYQRMDQLRRQKEEQSVMINKKKAKMQKEICYLGDKENETFKRLDKSEEALRQLKYAVDRILKMNENELFRLKNKIQGQMKHVTKQKLIEKMLLVIVESQNPHRTTFHTRKIHHSKLSQEHRSSFLRE